MPAFIKTKAQEKKWKRAKEIAKEQGVKAQDGKTKKQSFYSFVSYLYQRMKKK